MSLEEFKQQVKENKADIAQLMTIRQGMTKDRKELTAYFVDLAKQRLRDEIDYDV